ncbi:uncharacterized protein LOC127879222 [Dreissena polymorpha]|uniref:uncharacterized protein LOC127879222 n=1 Tax=Dreissena polymorpha TaxID=45954 RepID=UPI002265351A|nr:uncharacterized protein LOC127879222 [Dreissena polymorpha]
MFSLFTIRCCSAYINIEQSANMSKHIILATFINALVLTVAKEPFCPVCARYEYDEKLLEMALGVTLKEIKGTNAKVLSTLADIEENRMALNSALEKAKDDIQKIVHEYRQINKSISILHDMKQRTWGSWGEWGQCNFSCKRGVTEGARVQTRFRNMTVDSVVMQTETDQRPCNSVQFAGCDKSSSADDNYATAFSFTDEIAQATCTAIRSEGGFVRAVRRTCSNQAVSCEDLCKSLSATCFNALHVYQPTNVLGRTETGKAGLKTYRYNSCSGSKCGPNFCCCTGDYTK